MYAQLTEQEIKTLSKHKASGAAWAVYTALAAHAWKKAEVFPSIERIKKVLGGHYSTRTIYSALRFLDKVGLIVRKAAKVKERFTLALKKASKAAKHGATRSLQNRAQVRRESHHNRKQNRKNYYRNSNKPPTAAQKDFKSMNQEHRTSAHNWLDLAVQYCFGDIAHVPPPKCKNQALMALNDKNNAVSAMFGDKIRKHLGHMLI